MPNAKYFCEQCGWAQTNRKVNSELSTLHIKIRFSVAFEFFWQSQQLRSGKCATNRSTFCWGGQLFPVFFGLPGPMQTYWTSACVDDTVCSGPVLLSSSLGFSLCLRYLQRAVEIFIMPSRKRRGLDSMGILIIGPWLQTYLLKIHAHIRLHPLRINCDTYTRTGYAMQSIGLSLHNNTMC